MVQAVEFDKLGPNMIVKVPVTAAGVKAIGELTYRGVSVNATFPFTLPHCLQVAEAVERGLKRRDAATELAPCPRHSKITCIGASSSVAKS